MPKTTVSTTVSILSLLLRISTVSPTKPATVIDQLHASRNILMDFLIAFMQPLDAVVSH